MQKPPDNPHTFTLKMETANFAETSKNLHAAQPQNRSNALNKSRGSLEIRISENTCERAK
jgi:hypothetical protein